MKGTRVYIQGNLLTPELGVPWVQEEQTCLFSCSFSSTLSEA